MADGFLAIKSNNLVYEVFYIFLICVIGAARSPGIRLCCVKLFAFMLEIVMLCVFSVCLGCLPLCSHLLWSKHIQRQHICIDVICHSLSCGNLTNKPILKMVWACFPPDRKGSQKWMSCHKLIWKRNQIWRIKCIFSPPKHTGFHTNASKPHVQAFSPHSSCQCQGRCDNFVICAAWFSWVLALPPN